MSDIQRLLSVIRGEDAPEPEEAPDATAGEPERVHAVTTPALATMGWQDQMRAAMGHSWRTARYRSKALSEREGGMVHGLLSAQPPSVRGQCEYAKSRAWVPPGHEGGMADRAGMIYHLLIGRPGVALGNTISGLCARPFRFAAALLIVIVCMAVLAVWLG